MRGLPHLCEMKALVLEHQVSSPPRSPASEKLCLIGSGWQMEPHFPINFYYTFRWRYFSCISDGAFGKSPTDLGFDFLPFWCPVEKWMTVISILSPCLLLLPAVIYIPHGPIGDQETFAPHGCPRATQTRCQGLCFPGEDTRAQLGNVSMRNTLSLIMFF